MFSTRITAQTCWLIRNQGNENTTVLRIIDEQQTTEPVALSNFGWHVDSWLPTSLSHCKS